MRQTSSVQPSSVHIKCTRPSSRFYQRDPLVGPIGKASSIERGRLRMEVIPATSFGRLDLAADQAWKTLTAQALRLLGIAGILSC